MRAGAQALTLLSVPLNVHVLRALETGPRPLMDLRRAVGSPPQTTMRVHMRTLAELGVIERQRQDGFPGSVDYELGRPGRDLLEVADVVQTWLGSSPDGPLALGSIAAKSSIKAFVEGWSSTIVRAISARPLSLTELNKLISSLSYPSLERRLGAMRLAGQIAPAPSHGRGTPYEATEWLRRAVAPLAAAFRWERQHLPGGAPVTPMDTEATFLLAIPLLSLPAEMSGVCRLAVEVHNGSERRLAGVLVGVKEGRIASCVSRLQGNAAGWASGSTAAWLQAIIERDSDRLEVGGDCDLAVALLDGLHGTLFGARQRA